VERRKYDRVRVDAMGSFFVKNQNECIGEFSANIVDICEHGIRIKAEASDREVISNCDKDASVTITFQALEEFDYIIGKEVKVFSGEAQVVHVENDNNVIYLGCFIKSPSQDILSYIEKRKISNYLTSLRKA